MLKAIPEASTEYSPVKMDATAVRVINAAAGCVDKLGFNKAAIDDIVAASGVSRATLYRRFGSREGIFTALLMQQAAPIVAACKVAIDRETGLTERIEAGLILAVSKMLANHWIKVLFEQGVNSTNLGLIRPVFIELVSGVLQQTLQQARASGEFNSKIEFADIMEWLLRDFILVIGNGPWDKAQLQAHVRNFIIPVLKGVPSRRAEEERLARMNRRLDDMQQTLEALKHHLLPEDSQ